MNTTSNLQQAINFTESLSIMEEQWKKQVDIEKNAKNRAYAFILEYGLLEQFQKFSVRHDNKPVARDTLRALAVRALIKLKTA